MIRRHRAPTRRRLLAFVPVLFLALACTACGGAPTAPVPPLATADIAPVQRLVTDPLVRLLPGLLSDRGAAAAIDAELGRVESGVADGRPDRVRRALRDLDAAVAAYAASPGFPEADGVALQALDLVRIRVAMILDAAASAGGAHSRD